MDKIQSANNQLFASIEEDMADKQPSNRFLQTKHRVTFSSDIEEYEDDLSDGEYKAVELECKDDDAIEKEIAEIFEQDEATESIGNAQLDGLLQRMSIEEIYTDDESLSEDNYTMELEVIEDATLGENKSNVISAEELSVPNETKPAAEEEKQFVSDTMISLSSDCGACQKGNMSSVRCKTFPQRPITSKIPRSKSANIQRTIEQRNRPLASHQEDVLKIHLNVRACCENKYLDNNRLPRYNGYISQYGLSKDQLEMRELNRRKYLEKRGRREREIMRAKQQISDLNEHAFQQWLVRKNHTAKPKYKNRYDDEIDKPTIKYHSAPKFRRSSERQEIANQRSKI